MSCNQCGRAGRGSGICHSCNYLNVHMEMVEDARKMGHDMHMAIYADGGCCGCTEIRRRLVFFILAAGFAIGALVVFVLGKGSVMEQTSPVLPLLAVCGLWILIALLCPNGMCGEYTASRRRGCMRPGSGDCTATLHYAFPCCMPLENLQSISDTYVPPQSYGSASSVQPMAASTPFTEGEIHRLKDLHIKDLVLGRIKVLHDRNEAAARQFDQWSLAPTVRVVISGQLRVKSKAQASEGWQTSFQNRSTILNPRWVYEDRKELVFRYDGSYAGHKYLAQGEFCFDEQDKICSMEHTVISGFEHVNGVVGRGTRSYHGANPAAEARNVQLVLRRIAVLNGRTHDDAVRLVDEWYAPDFVVNVKAVWYKNTGRDGLIKAFDDAFAAGSAILEPQILEDRATEERVEYFYRGLYQGAAFNAFCSASFTPEGKFLSESWRVVV